MVRDPVPTDSISSPDAPVLDAQGQDPELLALPAPSKRARTATVGLMLVTAALALWMAFSLRGEASYALSSGDPAEVGDLTSAELPSSLGNQYVRASALLGTAGAIKYGRAAEGDSFRLAPVAGRPNVWVEMRVPEGFEGPRFVPPTLFAGRLVPFSAAGIRHSGLAASVAKQSQVTVPADAWLLIDGSSPRTARWAVALVALFGAFAAWNLASVYRILTKVRG